MEGECDHKHGKSVAVEVEWTEAAPSPQMQEKGIEAPMDHNITCHVQEEVMLSKKELEGTDWVGCEDLHPFWLIKRDTRAGNHNCEMKVKGFKQCSIPDVADLQEHATTKLLADGHTFHIHFPFIVNHTRIEKDAEVVLKWEQNLNQPRGTDKKRKHTAFDQLLLREVAKQKTGVFNALVLS